VARHVLLTKHVGLPNIVADARILPEVLQDQLTPQRLAQHLMQQWAEGAVRAAVRNGLTMTRERLGAGGAIARITQALNLELDLGTRRQTHDLRSATEMM
jgi:lipid-A-disaccharide synthase